MTRGAQRERDREKQLKDQAKAKEKRQGTGRAGINPDAEALQKKIEEKKKLIEQGLLTEKPKTEKKEKPKAMVNPHTGKHDPEWTKKMTLKDQGLKE